MATIKAKAAPSKAELKEAARLELRERARHELLRRNAQQSLASFVLYTYPTYQMGWFHREICETLEQFLADVAAKKSPRLILTAPPRSGKSELTSRRFPAYAFGRYPDLQIIATSYGADLSQRFNRDVQRIIDDDVYRQVFPETTLFGKNVRNTAKGSYIRTSDLFEIVGHKGAYRSCGVGGGITGTGADILVIDDPVKDRASANSVTIRNAIWDWYTSTAYTRLSPGGGIVVMQTRWSPIKDDTPVLTSHGWKHHGDLTVGDQVFGLDGALVTITHVGEPVMCTVKATTRTESIICGENHVWPIKTRAEHNPVNHQAKKLIGKPDRLLPQIEALDYGFDQEQLPIDPYWFGLWLGDGSKSGPVIRCGRAYTAHCESTPYAFKRTADKKGNFFYSYRFQGLRGELDRLGVLFNKHIPRLYLEASKESRLQLLAGLIDSDGDYAAAPILRFANTNQRLFDDVRELVSSLGMNCNNAERVNEVGSVAIDGYTRNYACKRFSFLPTVEVPCRVLYKRPRVRPARLRGVSFSMATPDECGLGRCITTTAKDGIYLVGKTLIPTHNCDDLVGRLIDHMKTGDGDTWTVINYPAIAEEEEPHRHIGEALHPERYPVEALNRIRAAVGERDWAALYQQHPVPDGGGLFKDVWIQHYRDADLPARFDRLLMSWDMTFKDSAGSDYVVGQVWGRKGAAFYLLDQVRAQMDFTKTLHAFVDTANKWPAVTRKLVEDKANGPAIISMLRKQVAGIIPITPKESKEARASAVSALWEAHNVYLPHPDEHPWVAREFIPELLSFPSGAHDDQVDAMTQALNDLRTRGRALDPSNIEQILGYY